MNGRAAVGWIILGGEFAGVCALSAWLARRWGRGAHSEMSVDMEVQARNRPPKMLM